MNSNEIRYWRSVTVKTMFPMNSMGITTQCGWLEISSR
jgi:hypothetical protein